MVPPRAAAAPAVRGRRDLLNMPSIAMVGARDASAAGRRMARDLARDLGQAGYVVVSGMARGVDGEAHAAAMMVSRNARLRQSAARSAST